MLKFNVFNQKLVRTDKNNPATDSVEYLEAQFTFNTDDWNGKAKSAIFTKGTSSYTVLLDSKGVCKVPFEVLQSNESSKLLGNTDKISVTLVGIYDNVRITTNELKINLNYSGYAEGQEPSEPTAEMYEQILTAYADAEAKCEETQQAFTDTLGLYANAIKGNVSGTTVTADDVSPIEHEVNVWVHGENLIPYPFEQTTIEKYGIKFTDNGDGTFDAVGTATENAAFYLNRNLQVLEKDMYLQGCPEGGSFTGTGYSLRGNLILDGKEISGAIDVGEGRKITIDKDVDGLRIYFVILAGTTVNLSSIKPMLHYGTSKTEYKPYINPTTATVTIDNVSYTPSSNGKIEGVLSNALKNGIATSTEGFTINVEYNKDINKVITKITDALGIKI